VDHVFASLSDLFHGEGDLHAVDLRRIEEAAKVILQAKNRQSLGGSITPDALEDTRAVVNHVGHNMDGGIPEVHQLATEPNFSLLIELGHDGFLRSLIGVVG